MDRTLLKGTTFDDLLEYGLKNKEYLNEKEVNYADLTFYKPPSLEELKKPELLANIFIHIITNGTLKRILLCN